MKKQLISLALTAAMLVTPLSAEPQTSPAPANTLGENYTYSIDAMTELGLLKGTGESLELDRTPTRAEAVTMIVRLDGGEEAANAGEYDHPFTDVPEWADGYIGYAYENGITKGISDTLFDPDAPVTGQQYITMVLRTLGYTDGGTYYGHSFAYETPFEMARSLGLLHAIRNGDEHHNDPAVLDMSYDYNYIGERIRQDFNRAYMACISFNALTCLKLDTDPTVTLFEANHYGKIAIENERLYEIFRHKQIKSGFESAVIVTKPIHKVEMLPYELTIEGTKYTLDGRSMIKLHQDGALYARATYDNYYLPLFATLELLGIEYSMDGNAVFASYDTLSPDPSRVTAALGVDKDESIYRADAYTLNMNGAEIPCRSRIVESHSTGLGSQWLGYADCFNILYRGELYIQIDTLAAALDMETDYISSIYTSDAPIAEQTVNKNLDILISDSADFITEQDFINANPEAFAEIVKLGEDALPYLKAASKDMKTESNRRKMAMAAAYAIKPELYDLVYPSPDGKHNLVLRVESFFHTVYHQEQATSYGRADLVDENGAVLCSVSLMDADSQAYDHISVAWSADCSYTVIELGGFFKSAVRIIDIKNAVPIELPSVKDEIAPLAVPDAALSSTDVITVNRYDVFFDKWSDSSSVKLRFEYSTSLYYIEGTYVLSLDTGEISDIKAMGNYIGAPSDKEE